MAIWKFLYVSYQFDSQKTIIDKKKRERERKKWGEEGRKEGMEGKKGEREEERNEGTKEEGSLVITQLPMRHLKCFKAKLAYIGQVLSLRHSA